MSTGWFTTDVPTAHAFGPNRPGVQLTAHRLLHSAVANTNSHVGTIASLIVGKGDDGQLVRSVVTEFDRKMGGLAPPEPVPSVKARWQPLLANTLEIGRLQLRLRIVA